MTVIAKKKIKKIELLSIFDDILREHGFDFTDTPPEMWDTDEKKIFDLLAELETKLKEEFLKVIQE